MRRGENITVIRLVGSSRRLIGLPIAPDQAVREVHSISTDPRVLGFAAGAALRAWRLDPEKAPEAREVCDLLTAAGADPDIRDRYSEPYPVLHGQSRHRR